MTTEIATLEDFERACQAHDPREDVERIWNAVVDTKLVPDARSQFYWRWPQVAR